MFSFLFRYRIIFSLVLIIIFIHKINSRVLVAQEDVFIPDHCDNIAEPLDHILLNYEISFKNNSFCF